MSTLERYQKPGGFIQLLSLIETSEPDKAKKFLSIIASENPAWEQAIIEKKLDMQKLLSFNPSVIMESLELVPYQVLAVAIAKSTEDIKSSIVNALSPSLKHKVTTALSENPDPKAGEIFSCQIRIFATIRKTISESRIKSSLLPEWVIIPDGIENLLAAKKWTMQMGDSSQTTGLSDPNEASKTNPDKGNSNTIDYSTELIDIKKRVLQLTDENHHLKLKVSTLEQKLDQIKKLSVY